MSRIVNVRALSTAMSTEIASLLPKAVSTSLRQPNRPENARRSKVCPKCGGEKGLRAQTCQLCNDKRLTRRRADGHEAIGTMSKGATAVHTVGTTRTPKPWKRRVLVDGDWIDQ